VLFYERPATCWWRHDVPALVDLLIGVVPIANLSDPENQP